MADTLNIEKLTHTLKQDKSELAQFGVARIGVFGSFARGSQTDVSDIDLLVEFQEDQKTFNNFMSVAYFLEDQFGRAVELVTPESLSPYMKERILEETDYVQVA